MVGRPSLDLSIGAASYATTIIRVSTDTDDRINVDGDQAASSSAIPITISPAPPIEEVGEREKEKDKERDKERERDKEKRRDSSDKKGGSRQKRSSSMERADGSKSKKEKVQKMLKTGVHKGQERITTISRKIGHGVARHGSLRRTNSTPGDFFSNGFCRDV